MNLGQTLDRSAWLACGASAVLILFAYPPFSVPVLPFVGLVPLLRFFSRPRTARQVVVGALSFSVPFATGSLFWLFYVAEFTAVGGILSAVLTILVHIGAFFVFPVAINVVNHRLRVPLALTAPVFWTLSEHVRAHGVLTFPWISLGYSLADTPLLAQHADLVGIFGLSFWLALVNALIVMLLSGAAPRVVALRATAIAIALALPIAYDVARWRQVEREVAAAPTLEIAVVQPNVPQRLKWDRSARDANVARLNELIVEAERNDPDLVVGPEACIPMVVSTDDDRLPAVIPEGRAPLLLGVVRGIAEPVEVEAGGRRVVRYAAHHNSAVLAGPDRRRLGAYDKIYLVPFSEQIPYRRVLGFVLPFMRGQFGRLVPPDGLELLTLPRDGGGIRFGVLICVESVYTELARAMAERDARLLVLITNDAWFGRSTMSAQHVGQAVVRAIECRRSVVVAANTGISAFVDPLGRTVRRSAMFEEAVLTADVPLMSGRSPYVRAGALVVYGCYAAGLVLLGAAWRADRARRRPRVAETGSD